MIENVVEIYYNSFQFANTIGYLEDEFNSAFSMFESLGKHYYEKSSNGEKHSRVARYEILLDFIREHRKNNKKRSGKWTDNLSYEQLLTLDFYLRENAKTRPAFAPDISGYKNVIRNFYKSETAREILPDYGNYDSRQLEKMTHMEVFVDSYGSLRYVLFDYKNKDLIKKEAKVQIIDIKG